MSNREHISVLNLRSHKDGIDRLDNNRHIAGSAGNVNPASLSKNAAATLCIALKHQKVYGGALQPLQSRRLFLYGR
jgi:hypothetical protein